MSSAAKTLLCFVELCSLVTLLFFVGSMPGVGRGAGEPPEAAWARLGPRGLIAQYLSLGARQAQLERDIARHNAAKAESLPDLMVRHYRRAAEGAAAAGVAMEKLHAAAALCGLTPRALEVMLYIRGHVTQSLCPPMLASFSASCHMSSLACNAHDAPTSSSVVRTACNRVQLGVSASVYTRSPRLWL